MYGALLAASFPAKTVRPLNVSFFQELLTTIGQRGRSLLERSRQGPASAEGVSELASALLSGRGEAAGVAIASELLASYRSLARPEKIAFFRFLHETLTPDAQQVTQAASAYLSTPSERALGKLRRAVESPRQEFFRRLNLAPGATAAIVAMRADLLSFLGEAPELSAVDADLVHLLGSWFNRGFLVLRPIDWSTPAVILEKIIQYEAVHEIQGWDDLRRRLDPRDRRCFGFFHPSLGDEPLIFVEVALTKDIPGSIHGLLAEEPPAADDTTPPTTAVFYSISNCQQGLLGISFGNFLIKQVVEDLAKELPSLKAFVTLSPAPRFAAWLVRLCASDEDGALTDQQRELIRLLDEPSWAAHEVQQEQLKAVLLPLAAHYFMRAKNRQGRPVDPVARFHLGNGARLERINWLGDKSGKGLRLAHGLMVNYRYDLKDIEKNHEAYVNEGTVVVSRAVRALLRPESRSKPPAKTETEASVQ